MATPIKRIEKEFLLKVLYDEQVPLMYLRHRTEYTLTLERPSRGEEIYLASDKAIPGLKPRKKLNLIFDFRGKTMSFSVEIRSTRDNHVITETPEFLYKNLDRSFSRVAFPPDMQVQFTFQGDRYSLAFPKIQEYEPCEIDIMMKNLKPENFSSLLEQIAAWAKDKGDGYKLVIFKDLQPTEIDERILAETGKAIYLPSTRMVFFDVDPYPKKRLVTRDIIKRFLESSGVAPDYSDDAAAHFVKSKFDRGILSDLWVPILFQNYIIGYIHVWTTKPERPHLDYGILETLYQFARVLSFSLKINGYFEAGRLKNEPFEGNIIDISASGVLFAYPLSSLSGSLLLDTELLVKISTAKRTVNAMAKIVRYFKDYTMGYFGCRFLDMAPEDIRFLFEFLYGRPFTDKDATFLAGQV